MHPLIYLFIRSFLNGVRRALTTPKRTVSLIVFGAYYYFGLLRPFQPAPAMATQFPVRGMLTLPDFGVIDGTIFGALALVSLPMISTILAYRGNFRPADVDVLFPTPVSPVAVLFFRILRDYLFTLLMPLIFVVFGWRGANIGLHALFRNYPSNGADLLRMVWVGWMLLCLTYVSLGYGASMFVGRSDLKSDTNRKVITGAVVVICAVAMVYVGLSMREDISWANALRVTHSPLLRALFIPATTVTAMVMGGLQGNWLELGIGLVGTFALIGGGLLGAVSQVGWLYDQAAARGFDSINLRNMRRSGNMYGQLAERARQGKLRRSRIAQWLSRFNPSGGHALVWKELLLQARGTLGGTVLIGTLCAAAFGWMAWMVRTSFPGQQESQAMLLVMPLMSAYMFSLTTGVTGFQELLRRVDLLKPLPFTPAKTVFWEVLGKIPYSAAILTCSVLISIAICPGSWDYGVAGLLLGITVNLTILASILLSVTLFPDLDDPTQRGLSGLVMLLTIVIACSPAAGLYALLFFFWHVPVLLCGILCAALLLLITFGLSSISGYTYASYSPNE